MFVGSLLGDPLIAHGAELDGHGAFAQREKERGNADADRQGDQDYGHIVCGFTIRLYTLQVSRRPQLHLMRRALWDTPNPRRDPPT